MLYSLKEAAAASSSSSCGGQRYEVFLSFRGEDTRDNFVSYLYGTLCRLGIHTFKDDEEFEKGKPISELILAIQQSRICVVVLSQNFANSSWCLDELERILACKDVHKQEIWPIFYNVDPSDVRRQEGSFGEAFDQLQLKLLLQERETNESDNLQIRIQKWRKALGDVSRISGYDTRNREQYGIVEEIAKKIYNKLDDGRIRSNTENLIGIDSRLEHLDLLIDVGSDDVRFVGIWGMGGIGKTAIARATYQRQCNKFSGHCFLPNVRESYRRNDPSPLQEQILRGVLRDRNFNLDNFSRGRGSGTVKERLCKKKVLIVLDDVDAGEQLKELVGGRDRYGPGSRIIITSREKQVLVAHGMDTIYSAEFLDHDESMQLFRRNAFTNNSHPPDEAAYAVLSEQMVEYAKGLPLALEILGSALCSKNIQFWESELAKLQRTLNPDIFSILKWSYDRLDDMQKDMFLDIACYFKGGTRFYVRDIMDSSGFCGESGIQVLTDKSLIKVHNNRIWMHDLVQELGREVVRGQSKHPNHRTRLWLYEDVCRALQDGKDKEAVEGLSFDLSVKKRPRWKFPVKAILEMGNLRVLRIGYMLHYRSLDYISGEEHSLYPDGSEYDQARQSYKLDTEENDEERWPGKKEIEKRINSSTGKERNFANYFWFCFSGAGDDEEECIQSKLVSVHWDRYYMESLPANFYPPSLTELSLSGNWIKQLWDGVKLLDKLKYVNLSYSKYLTSLPDLSGAPNLERLILDNCECLTELHRSIAFLRKLVFLSLNGCKSLRSLPPKLRLVSLQHLDFCGCSSFTVFPLIAEPMPCLTELNLSGSQIEEILPSISKLSQLARLDLSSCQNLRKLPKTICELRSLESLKLSRCTSLESFPEIGADMPKLREVLLNATRIRQLPLSFKRLVGLKYLNINDCSNLTPPSDIRSWGIDHLLMDGCMKLGD